MTYAPQTPYQKMTNEELRALACDPFQNNETVHVAHNAALEYIRRLETPEWLAQLNTEAFHQYVKANAEMRTRGNE